MGRSSGFIAMHASLASGQIDICLIPEVLPSILLTEFNNVCICLAIESLTEPIIVTLRYLFIYMDPMVS